VRKTSALTLLEVTLVSFLVSLLLFMSWQLIPRTLFVEKNNGLRRFAIALMKEEISQMRAIPADQLRSGRWRRREVVGPESCKFEIESDLSQVDTYPLRELRQLRVEVRWSFWGQTRKEELVVHSESLEN